MTAVLSIEDLHVAIDGATAANILRGVSLNVDAGEVRGLVGNPRMFSREDLMALPAETVQVNYLAGQGSDGGSFTGL